MVAFYTVSNSAIPSVIVVAPMPSTIISVLKANLGMLA
jgi:hypothetical protein